MSAGLPALNHADVALGVYDLGCLKDHGKCKHLTRMAQYYMTMLNEAQIGRRVEMQVWWKRQSLSERRKLDRNMQ